MRSPFSSPQDKTWGLTNSNPLDVEVWVLDVSDYFRLYSVPGRTTRSPLPTWPLSPTTSLGEGPLVAINILVIDCGTLRPPNRLQLTTDLLWWSSKIWSVNQLFWTSRVPVPRYDFTANVFISRVSRLRWSFKVFGYYRFPCSGEDFLDVRLNQVGKYSIDSLKTKINPGRNVHTEKKEKRRSLTP